MQRLLFLVLAIGWATLPVAPAQTPCFGRGQARLLIPSATLGNTITIGLEANPGATLWWLADTLPGRFPVAGGGAACLAFSPALVTLLDPVLQGVTMPATGRLDLPVLISPSSVVPGLVLYSQFAAIDPMSPGGFALSSPASLQVALPDGYNPTLGLIASLGTSLHTATAYGEGRFVLLAGGGRGSLIAPTPENLLHRYDHYTRDFTLLPVLLRVPRAVHTATLLNDGRILIAGGTDGFSATNWSDAEVFDPATGSLTPVANAMQVPRGAHTATKLPDGRVLLIGGNQIFALNPTIAPIFQTANQSTDIYDPVTNTFSAGPMMTRPRVGHSALLLPSGEVLVVGGIEGGVQVSPTVAVPTLAPDAEIYDPVTNTFRTSGTLTSPRFLGSLVALPSGAVLYAGGGNAPLLQTSSDSEAWYPIGGGVWSPFPNLPIDTAFGAVASLPNGQVALIGGATGNPFAFTSRNDVLLFDEATQTYTFANPLPAPRVNLTCTPMPDGTFLVAGGGDAMGFAVTDAYLWNP